MRQRCFLVCTLWCAILLSVSAANAGDRWQVQGHYLEQNGKPAFLTGANYVPSTGWLFILEHWEPASVERDIVALRKLGITSLRFPPLWPLLQPQIDKVSAEKLARVNELISIAHRNGVAVQIDPITGWMSGASFIPKWAEGNIFTEPQIVRGTATLAGEVARALRDNPGLQGYDFGNEVNDLGSMMRLKTTPEQTAQWMETIYRAFRDADPHHPITNGVGGFGGSFDIWNIAAASDYMSVHSYAYFNRTLNLDPWIGQRTTYGADYTTAYAAMTGKPVLIQEIGCSESWLPKMEIAKFLRLTLMSAWAQGAAGYFWWGSHNIDTSYRPPAEYINLKYSKKSFADGRFDDLEYSMGLLDNQNRPKPYALEYQRWAAVIDKLGVGWKDELPVCYLLHPEGAATSARTMTQMTAFVLAKQNHMQVRIWPEWKPIPGDAAAVVIAGFSLSPAGRNGVGEYLHRGGVVYQSNAGDFIEARDSAETLSAPVLVAAQAEGRISHSERVRLGVALKLKEVAPDAGSRLLLGAPEPGAARTPLRVFLKSVVGKGTYYYLAADLEEALSRTYDPWDADDSNLIYSVLRPETPFDIDSKYVEFAVKTRGSERLFLLLNHSNRSHDVVFRSASEIQLRDYLTHVPLGCGKEIPLRLMPGEVLIAAEIDERR